MICHVVRTEGGKTTTKTFQNLLAAVSYIDEMEEKIEGWWNELTPRNFQCDLVFEGGFSIQETVVNDAGTFTDPQKKFDEWDLSAPRGKSSGYTAGPKGEFMHDFQTWLIDGLCFEYGLDDGEVYRIIQMYVDGKPIVTVSIGHGGYTAHRYKWNDSTFHYEGVS